MTKKEQNLSIGMNEFRRRFRIMTRRMKEICAVFFSAAFCAVSLTACGSGLFGSSSKRSADSYEMRAETAADYFATLDIDPAAEELGVRR